MAEYKENSTLCDTMQRILFSFQKSMGPKELIDTYLYPISAFEELCILRQINGASQETNESSSKSINVL